MLKKILGLTMLTVIFVLPFFAAQGYAEGEGGIDVNFTSQIGTTTIVYDMAPISIQAAEFDFSQYYWKLNATTLVAGSLDTIPTGVPPTVTASDTENFDWQVRVKENETIGGDKGQIWIYRGGSITTVPEDGSWVTICTQCSGNLEAYEVYKFATEAENSRVRMLLEYN